LGGLAWSPDGREVWFSGSNSGADRHLYAVTVDGKLRLVTRVPGNLILHDIAADGRVLVSHGTIHPVMLALVPGEAKERDLTWLDFSIAADLSADGKTLLFTEEGVAGGPQYAVYTRGTDGSPAVRLGKGNAQALSPDGAWALTLDLAPPPQLVLLPTGPGEPQRLPRHAIVSYVAASWMPDGKAVMFVGAEAGHPPRTYIQDLAGGPPRAVTPEGVFAFGKVISPDGRFMVGTNGTDSAIYPVTGGDPRPIPGLAPGELAMAWATDGGLYLRPPFQAAQLPFKVDRLDPATGRRQLWKEIAPADPSGVTTLTRVILTPDARWYAYTYIRSLSNLYLIEGLK
jgi:hypothetical protein